MTTKMKLVWDAAPSRCLIENVQVDDANHWVVDLKGSLIVSLKDALRRFKGRAGDDENKYY